MAWDNFLNFYQYIPERLNPIILTVGPFSVGWYSLSYLAGFLTVLGLVIWRIKKGESDLELPVNRQKKIIFDWLLYSLIGLLIGARLGYILFYDFSYFLHNPWEIISPFDPVSVKLVGIYGMSYHGGLIGVIIATLVFIKRHRVNFWKLSELVIPAVPAGYFFGRIGNFFNGELYGRVTQKLWGMHFPLDPSGFLRHPSQLYEAFLEGIVLFIVLWLIRNKKTCQGNLLAFYLIGYALVRIICEFFRQPDEQIGFLLGVFTLGQLFSSVMFLIGLVLIYCRMKRKIV